MSNPLAQTRRDARERAIELAYECEQRGLRADALLATLVIDPDPFAALLLKASELQRERAETMIAERSRGWTLDRMPLIDRLVMRMAVAEMITTDTPTGVILAEAVDLVGRYSTDESTRFVNGVLSAIAGEIRPVASD